MIKINNLSTSKLPVSSLWITFNNLLPLDLLRILHAEAYIIETPRMSVEHTLLEVRTSRDSLQTAEAAVQIFATFPKLRDAIWHKALGRNEHMSFEIVVVNQTVSFQVYLPTRLVEYMKSVFVASYPEALVNPLGVDPVSDAFSAFQVQSPQLHLTLGSLSLKNNQYLPLKTYQEFREVDPLSSLIATLSKTNPEERIVFQVVVSNTGDGWKNSGYKQITDAHPQKAFIEQKLSQTGLKTSIRAAVLAPDKQRSQLLLDSIASSIQSITQSEGNRFVLRKSYVLKKQFLQIMVQRRFSLGSSQHLTTNELATLYHFPTKQLVGIPNIAWGKQLLGEPPEELPVIYRDMDPILKDEINPYARTEYKNTSMIYGVKRADRRRHMYVIGKTGTGKSTLLANMAINDLKRNEGLCVIDPHGDLVETLLNYIPSHRINDVIYFNPADGERTVKINLFEGENVVHRELIASGIVSIFQKLYSYSWGPRLEYILRNALLTLLKSEEAKMSDILDLLTNKKFRDKVVEKLEDPILSSFWKYEFNTLTEKQRNDQIASILNKVGQFVSSPLVRNVVNTTKSSFSIEEVMSQGKILIVNLSQGQLGEDNATLLGAMLITKIQLAAMNRVNVPEEERRDFYLYVDEFQNFATDSFIKILSEARKYRLNLILANQYIAQIPEEVQKAIFGNCGNIVSFVMGADDAAVFQREYGEKYTHEDLVALGRYQIINKISIDNVVSNPFPAQTLSMATSNNKNRDKVIRVSRERYATKRQSP